MFNYIEKNKNFKAIQKVFFICEFSFLYEQVLTWYIRYYGYDYYITYNIGPVL